jgi:hypothetical protein
MGVGKELRFGVVIGNTASTIWAPLHLLAKFHGSGHFHFQNAKRRFFGVSVSGFDWA